MLSLILMLLASPDSVQAFAAEYGKPFGYEMTLQAISWQEASFIQNICNVNEDSCGPFGNRVSVVARRTGLHPAVVKHRLLTNLTFAAQQAVDELDWWKSRCTVWRKAPRTKEAWRHVWGHYNGGYKPNLAYADSIRVKIKRLRRK